jgi:hypothetical protein
MVAERGRPIYRTHGSSRLNKLNTENEQATTMKNITLT